MRDFAQVARKRSARVRRKPSIKFLPKLIQSIFAKILFLGFILLIIAFSIYIFAASVLPQFFTLEMDQNIALISRSSSAQKIIIVHFFESNKTILLEVLDRGLMLQHSDANHYSKSELSFNLGSMIDGRLFFDDDIEIRNVVDLQNNLQRVILANQNQEISLINLLRLYFFSKNSFVNFMIKNEENIDLSSYSMINNNANKCAVAVINNSRADGLAKRISQIFENSGYLVLRVDSGIEELAVSKIYVDQEQSACQSLVNRLVNVFPIELENNNNELIERYRVGVVFSIGKDYEQYCSN